MREIKINGEKLKLLVREAGIDFSPGVPDVIPEKENLRYQYALLSMDSYEDVPIFQSIKAQRYHKVSAITRSITYLVKTKEVSEPVKYTRQEITDIVWYLRAAVINFPRLSERIARGLGKKIFLDTIEKAYGRDSFYDVSKKLRCYLPAATVTDEEFMKTWDGLDDVEPEVPKARPRAEYSIYRLCQDLVKDGAGIIIDNTLIKYRRISKRPDFGSSPEYAEKALKIVGFQGNKARANVSLTYEVPEEAIVIPENPYGITAGNLKRTRNYCVIRDGKLNMKSLAVKVSKEMIRKFKILGIFNRDLVREGECVISLETLPILRPRDIKPMSGYYLSYLEIKSAFEGAKLNYLEILKEKSKTPEDKEKDNFLGSNNISLSRQVDGGLNYKADRKYNISEPSGKYIAPALVKSGVPTFTKFAIETATTRKKVSHVSKASMIADIWLRCTMAEVDLELKGDTLDNLISKYAKARKETDSKIAQGVFEFIYNKRTKFPGSNGMKIKINSFGWESELDWKYTEKEITV
jgi:hypothetical protein